MICQSCIHYEVCHIRLRYSDPDAGVGETCAEFKQKDLYIPAPVTVGMLVYAVWESDEPPSPFIEKNVVDVGTKGFWVSAFDPPEDDFGFMYSYEEIGKTVFLSEEEAKEVLRGERAR